MNNIRKEVLRSPPVNNIWKEVLLLCEHYKLGTPTITISGRKCVVRLLCEHFNLQSITLAASIIITISGRKCFVRLLCEHYKLGTPTITISGRKCLVRLLCEHFNLQFITLKPIPLILECKNPSDFIYNMPQVEIWSFHEICGPPNFLGGGGKS